MYVLHFEIAFYSLMIFHIPYGQIAFRMVICHTDFSYNRYNVTSSILIDLKLTFVVYRYLREKANSVPVCFSTIR